MTDDLSFEGAIDTLERLRAAAPPVAAARLSNVIDLLHRLHNGQAPEVEADEIDRALDAAMPRLNTGMLRALNGDERARPGERLAWNLPDPSSLADDDADATPYPSASPRPPLIIAADPLWGDAPPLDDPETIDDLIADVSFAQPGYDPRWGETAILTEPEADDAAPSPNGGSVPGWNTTAILSDLPADDAPSFESPHGFHPRGNETAILNDHDTDPAPSVVAGFDPQWRVPHAPAFYDQLPDFPNLDTGIIGSDYAPAFSTLDGYLERPVFSQKDTDRLTPLGSAFEEPEPPRANGRATSPLDFAETNFLELLRIANADAPPIARPPRPPDDVPPDPHEVLSNLRQALRPPLVLLHAQTELLSGRIESAPPDQIRTLRLMQDNAENALQLLDSIDLLTMLAEHELRLDSRNFDPVDMLRDVGDAAAERARRYQHRVQIRLDEGLPRACADYRRTFAILLDLIDNALRYSPEGSTTQVTAESLETHILFTVQDSGIGLNADDLEAVGRPFWRAAYQPRVRQHRGTGLRLYLARRVLEAMGGELYFSGEPNVGSTFSFTLPTAARV